MERKEIIQQLAEKREVEKIIKNLGCFEDSSKDLAQDIYFSLLSKDILEDLYDKGELNYYITRMVKNNINSNTSPYYTTYKKKQQSYGLIEDVDDRYIQDT